jgi:hypothetical protein
VNPFPYPLCDKPSASPPRIHSRMTSCVPSIRNKASIGRGGEAERDSEGYAAAKQASAIFRNSIDETHHGCLNQSFWPAGRTESSFPQPDLPDRAICPRISGPGSRGPSQHLRTHVRVGAGTRTYKGPRPYCLLGETSRTCLRNSVCLFRFMEILVY